MSELRINKCPRCGGNVVLRKNKRDSGRALKFLGCDRFPECKWSSSISSNRKTHNYFPDYEDALRPF